MPNKNERAAPAGAGNGSEIDQLAGKISSENTPAAAKSQAARRSRNKGARIEREIIDLHRRFGIHAERVPLSGAAHYKGAGHDVDIFPFGKDAIPFLCEVKGRKGGDGFKTLERWLGDNDALFLKRNNADPLILLPARIWFILLDRVR
ncbi:MAG: hypothetical protein P4L57_08945 [Rhizomicrobium sp.]|nr:hypothetical protein [Rhizomicrobium sp.]